MRKSDRIANLLFSAAIAFVLIYGVSAPAQGKKSFRTLWRGNHSRATFIANYHEIQCTGNSDDQLISKYSRTPNIFLRIVPHSNCVFTATAVLPSMSTLDAREANITSVQNTGSVFWMIENSQAKYHTVNRSFTATLASGSTTVTSDTANFTSGDLRQSLRCTDGFDGVTTDFDTMISRIVSSSSVVISPQPPQSSGAYSCSIIYRDQNIRILGGNWSMTGAATPYDSDGQIFLESCNECSVSNAVLDETSGPGAWHIWALDTDHFRLENDSFFSTQELQDGFDCQLCTFPIVKHIRGLTGDDMIAIRTGTKCSPSCAPASVSSRVYGAWSNADVEDISGASVVGAGVRMSCAVPGADATLGYTCGPVNIANVRNDSNELGYGFVNTVLLVGGSANTIDVATIDGLYGRPNASYVAITRQLSTIGSFTVADISVSGMDNAISSNKRKISLASGGDVAITNLHINDSNNSIRWEVQGNSRYRGTVTNLFTNYSNAGAYDTADIDFVNVFFTPSLTER